VQHQDLAVTPHACANADGRDAQFPGDACSNAIRNHLENNHCGARLLDGQRIVEQALRVTSGFSLDAIPPQLARRLRRQADVSDDGYASSSDRADDVGHLAPTFELHSIHPGLLEEATSVANCLSRVTLVGHEGQVADEVGVLSAASHGLAVMDHLVHRDGHG